MIIDRHCVVAESLSEALARRSDLEVCGYASSQQEALDIVKRFHPDVVLVDYELAGNGGVEAAQAVKGALPETGVILLTGRDDDHVVAEAIEGGCDGLLRKSATLGALLEAIDAVIAGGEAFSRNDLCIAVRELRSRPSRLSQREFQVLALLGVGASTVQMANRLHVSPHTIRSHVRHVLEKLGAHSKLEAVAIATREGLIDPTAELCSPVGSEG
ncbi:MAG: response regulator transcription factor [Actinobacteria bacterium]|nr:response regulator transcription factor [Actinomycetota bacterium]